MAREVTLENLNIAYAKALFSSVAFWIAAVLYVLGLICLEFSMLLGGIIMLVAAIIMINADWFGRKRVVRNLMWKK